MHFGGVYLKTDAFLRKSYHRLVPVDAYAVVTHPVHFKDDFVIASDIIGPEKLA